MERQLKPLLQNDIDLCKSFYAFYLPRKLVNSIYMMAMELSVLQVPSRACLHLGIPEAMPMAACIALCHIFDVQGCDPEEPVSG